MRFQRVLFFQFLVLQLVMGTIFQTQFAWAATSNQVQQTTVPIQILEITDSGVSDISSQIGSNANFSLTTLSMKKFVSLRQELDGKYDVIYIGSGTYSTEGVSYSGDNNRAAAHNTKNIMNDITNLQANKIKQEFIEKGQPVILHQDVFKQASSKLYSNFNTYRTQPRSNVVVVTSANAAYQAMQSAVSANKRPQVELTGAPDPYTGSSGTIYNPGDTISFAYNIVNYGNLHTDSLQVNFYLDANFDHKFDPIELFETKAVTSQAGSIAYTLPKGYSGPRYWKVEIVDTKSNLKDYHTGVFRFRDQKVEVKVLQVTRSGTDSSLQMNTNMNQTFLSSSDYQISIDVTTMDTFKSSRYQSLNGSYDMLIFGFADVYNNASLSTEAVEAVKQFIQTGQSVLFTHDTIFQTGNSWVNNFMTDTGQIAPRHDLGLNAPNQSTVTARVNEGLLTQFPFFLDDSVTIATTHNQYYTLDLEDERVIPWYNIIGSSRDVDDSWNHYYTYSKGNVTYSGTGHTNQNFKEEEQRLFVNTMYRAFIGSNHAPQLLVYSPTDQTKVTVGENLTVTYTAEDLDLTDHKLTSRIYVNNQLVYSNNQTLNGATISQQITNPQTQPGTFTVKVEIEDIDGAKVVKENIVTVTAPITSNVNLLRSITPSSGIVKPNDTATINYQLSLDPIAAESTPSVTGIRPFALNDVIQYHVNDEVVIGDKETPGNFGALALGGKGADVFKNNVKNGYTVPIQVGEEVLTEPGNKLNSAKTEINALKGSVITVPIVKGLGNGRDEVEVTGFASLRILEVGNQGHFEAKITNIIKPSTTTTTYKVTNIRYTEKFPANLDVTGYPNYVTRTGDLATGYTLSGTIPEITYTKTGNQYTAQPVKFPVTVSPAENGVYVLNQSNVTYSDTNQLPITNRFNELILKAETPVTSVSVSPTSKTLRVDEQFKLIATVAPESASNKAIVWSTNDSDVATVSENGVVKGIGVGETTITVKTVDGNFTATARIKVINAPVTGVSLYPKDLYMYKNTSEQLRVTVHPSNADNKNVTWRSSDSDVASVDQDGKVTAHKVGTATITVKTTDGGFEDTADVNVIRETQFELFYDQGATQPVPDYNVWLDRPVYVKLTFAGNVDRTYKITNDNSSPSVIEEKEYTGPFLINQEGTNVVEFYERPGEKESETVKIDSTVPSVVISGGTVNTESKTVTGISITASSGNSNGDGTIDKITAWIVQDDGRSDGVKERKGASMEYDTPSTTKNSITVYAQAVSKSGRQSQVVSQTYSFDTMPPQVELGSDFIKQEHGGKGVVTLKVSASDTSGVAEVRYRVERLTNVNGSYTFVPAVISGNLQNSGDNWTGSIDVGENPGWYRVIIQAIDEVRNDTDTSKTKEEIVSQLSGLFFVSPGYTLASKLDESAVNSNKPVTVSFVKVGGSYFKIADAEVAAQLQEVPLNLGVHEIKYAILPAGTQFSVRNANGSLVENNAYQNVVNHPNWKPLKNTEIVVTVPGTWIVQIMITDNYKPSSDTKYQMSHIITSQPFTISPSSKKM